MVVRCLVLACLALSVSAAGQKLINGLPPVDDQVVAAQAAADAAQARADAAFAAIPVRASTLPPSEKTIPTIGTSMAYRGADDPQPRITRTASCTITVTSGVGSCDVNWDGSSFPAGTTVRLAGAPAVVTTSVGATSEQPMMCKAYNLTITGISFRCWQAQSSALTLSAVTAGFTVLPFSAPAPSVVVMVTAIPTS